MTSREHELHSEQHRNRVIIAFAAIYIIWGSTYLAIKFAIETLPPFLMAGTRFVIAGTILYGWARLKGAAKPKFVHWRSAAVVGGLLLLGGNGGVVWSEQFVPSGLAALLIATEPLWIALLVWLTPGGTRPPGRVAVGLVLGFMGAAILVGPGELIGAGSVHPLGAAVLMFAALSWAAGSLYSRRANLPSSPFLGIAMEMLAGGFLLLVFGLLVSDASRLTLALPSLRSLLSLGYLIVFGSLVGFTAYIWLLRVTTPARASTYAFVNPVVAVLLGWLVAGEPLTARTLLAAAIIVPAVALIITHPTVEPPEGEKPVAAALNGGALPVRSEATQSGAG